MAKTRLETGSMLDGFLIGELIHRGGMAYLWEVSKPGDPAPMLMKIPVLHEGEDPAAIVSFEMEQLIMPRLKGAHVPRHIANGDFGLAHHRNLPDLLQEEFRLPYGTAPYMAPEQVMGVRNDHRSDLFALGCLMYFFATGTRPFGDPRKLKGLKQRLWKDPEPPRKLNPDLPLWFQEIVLRCLEVRAGRRHPSAAQLAHDLRNPDQVVLTDRAAKLGTDGFFAVLKRKGEPGASLIDKPPETPAEASDAQIVAVAVNLDDVTPELAVMLRRTASRLLERAPDARLACINVLRLNRIAMDQSLDEQGSNKHVQKLVELKDWARELKLEPRRITFHVLEAFDPAEAILDYARQNNVDHLIMGARENSTLRKILGSVSAKVAAEAPCTVTVVRNRQPAEE